VDLDDIDAAILKSLLEDGRKSFRAISREVRVSTPTAKARYERLVNIGLIKSIKPEIDMSRLARPARAGGQKSLQTKLRVKLSCDQCGGPVHGRPKVLRFAGFERFFCCTQCRASYKEKHGSRIEALKRSHG
jgi:Lrp/AsnC family leucine-responsive transcriptional regulator